jgi:hypothetical protein
MGKLKNKPVKIITSLNFGCYPGYVLFTAGFSFDEIRMDLKKKKSYDWLKAIENEEFKDAAARAFKRVVFRKDETRTCFFVMIKKPFAFTDQDYIILAHEMLHICQFYTPDVFDRNREIEAEAYIHSHLMEQALSQMRGK